jgi:hypothetical protein
MTIEGNHILIRDFERKDAEDLYRIVREKNILRFMTIGQKTVIRQSLFMNLLIGYKAKKTLLMFMKIKEMK